MLRAAFAAVALTALSVAADVGAGFELVAHHEQWPAEADSYRRPPARN